jgi:polyphosphate kinase 2 (PPK2 family)
LPQHLPAKGDHPKITKRHYDEHLRAAQLHMRSVALALHSQGGRGIVVVEGTDTAGKGGAIRRLTAELDPRWFQVWPIGPPSPDERRQHYMQRFWQRMPLNGRIAIFDRSWYGRVLVERVDGLIPEARWREAYDEIRRFEDTLVADGVRVAKFYLHVTEKEQQDRLIARAEQPHKWWKISEADIRAHLAYDAYTTAAEEMVAETSTEAAPWTVIAANSKRHARLIMLDEVAKRFGKDLDLSPTPMSDELQRMVRDVLGVEENS